MDISPETISKYKIKKVLKISILTLLFFVIGLLIFEYFRITPRNVYFSNVTSSSVTVSWNTKNPTSATVIPFEGNSILPIRLFCLFKEKYFDTRDVERAQLESIENIEQRVTSNENEGLSSDDFEIDVDVKKVGKYTTHQVKIQNLHPETNYSFLVGDTILFRKVNDFWGNSVTKTTEILENLKTPSPTYGAVLDAENTSDIAINELKPVLDGIIYLNLYDKDSEKRSNIFSASLNKEGKWYIDISNAIDSEGNNFIETYSIEGVNLYYELELDAGKLGRWKTRDLASRLSPLQPFVINTPDAIQDIEIPGSVVKISNNVLGTFVPSLFAEEGVCAFSTYCEYQAKLSSDGLYHKIEDGHTCSNQEWINSTLVSRKCTAGNYESPKQENDNLSCSGRPVDSFGVNNNICYRCEKDTQNGYYISKWKEAPDYVPEGSKCVKKQEPVEVPEEIEEEEGNEEKNKVDNIKDEMIVTDEPRYCDDPDGCICIWPNNDNLRKNAGNTKWCTIDYLIVKDEPAELGTGNPLELKNNEYCVKTPCQCKFKFSGTDVDKTISSGEYCTDNKKTGFMESGTCKDRDGCTCEGNSIVYDSYCEKSEQCDSTNKNGDPCTTNGSIVYGIWFEDSCSCFKTEPYKGAFCFESNDLLFKNLVYWNDGRKLACIGGKMTEVSTSTPNNECKEGQTCFWNGIRERCLASDLTTLLYCKASTAKWEKEKDDKSDSFLIGIFQVKYLDPGQKCQLEVCLCKTGVDHKIERDEFCIETSSCTGQSGKVCNKLGNTCKLGTLNGVNNWDCTGEIKTSMTVPSSKLISNSIVPKAFAQASETEEYIIDSSTGLISGIASGIYTFELDGITYMFFVDEEALGANNGKILIFIDKDGNGIYDEGTDTKVSELASKIAISTIQKEYSYKLKQGFNFVSFPFLNVTESARTALGLLEMLNTLTNGSVYSIAKFDSSWEIVGKNGDTYLSNDFQLIPGQGYVIKVIKDVEVSMQGYPIKFESEEDSAPITLFTGWNLIGVYGSKAKVYTAKTMLQDINAFEEIDFTADIVNGWDQEAQSYEGFVLENTNGIESEYGFDFPINTLKSYFVRVADGKGNWQPSLAE